MLLFRLNFFGFVFLLNSTFIFSQTHIYTFQNNISLSVNGQNLKNAWAGGFNSAQINKMDLDQDGIEDLVIFDKTTAKLSTFIFNNNKFQYAPKYELSFPKIQSWLKLADYNCDGKKDIFTSGSYATDVGVFLNTSVNNQISWQQVSSGLTVSFVGGNSYNIYSSPSDYPSLTDIDNDGDTDIMTYSGSGTNGIEFNINRSMELYGDCGHLAFEKYTFCYGLFSSSFDCNTPVSINQTCPAYLGGTHDQARQMHNGASISIFDLDGDNKKDILLGDVTCNNIQALYNTGSNTNAYITTVNLAFPTQYPINIQSFPVSFFEDIDGDSIKDLLASPNVSSSDDYLVDTQNSLWMYKNTGTNLLPNFSFVGENFLQNEMIDLGENASPALFDYDLDGDLDLFVGNKGIRKSGNAVGTIYLYKNIGSKDSASFRLENEDYLSISGLNFSDFRIGFAPVDDNNSSDIYFLATNSDFEGELYFIPNNNENSQIPDFNIQNLKPVNIDAYYTYPYDKVDDSYEKFSKSDYIHIFRYKGELKLLFGTNQGHLQLYNNTFSGGLPNFSFAKDDFLGISNDDNTRYSVKAITKIKTNDSLDIFTTNSLGELRIYQLASLIDTDSFTSTNTIILNPEINTVQPAKLGTDVMLSIANLHDNDTIPDLIIGTKGGGLLYLKNEFVKTMLPPITIPGTTTSLSGTAVGANISISQKPFRIYPNPVESILNIETEVNSKVKIIDFLGRSVNESRSIKQGAIYSEDITKLNSGVYFIQIEAGENTFYEKVIVKPPY